jgi:hypothetical protein
MEFEGIKLCRMQKKIDKRDRKIAALEKEIRELKSALCVHSLMIKKIPVDVTKAVQSALCNVRMIPIIGVGGSDRIIDIQVNRKTGEGE